MKGYKVMSESQRMRAFLMVKAMVKDGKVPHGGFTKVAKTFGVTRFTISRLWARAGSARTIPLIKSPIQLKVCKRTGRPPKYDKADLRAQVKSIPLKQRKCIRDLSERLHVPKSTVHLLVSAKHEGKKNGFRCHSSSLKPMLTEQNKFERVMFALSKRNGPVFKAQEDEIHVDEKWFYLTRDQENYIMLEEEEDPRRLVKHKSHIDKVMFLAATAKPRWDPNKSQWFDGKLGLWPFAHQVPAQRASANRPAGALEWKSISVNREVYKKMMIEKLLPAIKEKWPVGTVKSPLFIQQDNAPVHFKPNDLEWLEAVEESGLNIKLVNQPPNSPDTNINDLAFFASIQSLQHKIGAGSNKGTLIASVNDAFAMYPWKNLRNSWLTLQCCFNSIIEHHGDNCYKIKHMSKERLEKAGSLPVSILVTEHAGQFYEEDANDLEMEVEDEFEEELSLVTQP